MDYNNIQITYSTKDKLSRHKLADRQMLSLVNIKPTVFFFLTLFLYMWFAYIFLPASAFFQGKMYCTAVPQLNDCFCAQ